MTDLERLRELELFAGDAALLEKLDGVKRRNKVTLARVTKELTGVSIDPLSMFDVQVKRVHEYKRQLLNALHVIDRYWSIVEDGVIRRAAAHGLLRRKSGAGLFPGKADHQAHSLDRRGRERRSENSRSTCRSSICRTTACRSRK